MNLSRRGLLALLGASAAAATVPFTALAARATPTRTPNTTQNGYPVIHHSECRRWVVDGIEFVTAPGEPTEVLKEFVWWFNRNIEPIGGGQLDDWSWSQSRQVRNGRRLSNHASGTAVDLNSARHPLGESGTFTAAQTARIRQKIATYDGALRWGADFPNPDEMHFEMVHPSRRR